MHPVIRIICFLVFVVCLSRADAGQLFLAMALLLLLYLYSPVNFLQPAVSMLRRLRWFFLSILVLYIWMTPDVSLLSTDTILSFLSPGVTAALGRIFSLLLIVFAVSYLLASLSQSQLIAAIYWLVAPFAYLGLAREKVVLRLALSIEAAEKLVKAPRFTVKNECKPAKNRMFNFYHSVMGSLQYYYQYVLGCAEKEAGREVSFDCLTPPAFWQWGFPAGLYAMFVLAGRIN